MGVSNAYTCSRLEHFDHLAERGGEGPFAARGPGSRPRANGRRGARALARRLPWVSIDPMVRLVAFVWPVMLQAGGARLLGLHDAEASAVRKQPTVRQAHAVTDAAVARSDQARAGYLPQVTATAQYQRLTGNFSVRPGVTLGPTQPPPASWATYNYFQFGLAGSQLVYDFGQTDQRWHASQRAADASHASERTAELAALLNVRRAFFQAQAQRALVRVARKRRRTRSCT